MKILGIIKKIFIGIVAVVFFAFAISMTVLLLNYNDYGVPQFGKNTMVIIRDDISSTNFEKGDVVMVEEREIKDIVVGEEIFIYKVNSENGSVSIDVGKIGEVHVDDDAITYENGSTYSKKFVIGKQTKVYEDIGTFLAVVTNKWGFLFTVLLPSFLIFIYEFYALVVEIKYGKEDSLR